MSSGFLGYDFDDESPGTEDKMQESDNYVTFTLDLPMHTTKIIGRDFTYFTAGVNLLGDIVNKSVPKGLDAYAAKKLFAPLGIQTISGFIHLKMFLIQEEASVCELLILQNMDSYIKTKEFGMIIKFFTKEWVEKSLAKQVSTFQEIDNRYDRYYGYVFWNKTYVINDKEYEVSFCYGNGGNKIFIFKDVPFVVVITASAYNKPGYNANVDKMMTDYILPAIME